MDFLTILESAFLDELEKIAAVRPDVRKAMRVAQTRSGRRSMRASTLLRKEKEGTLWKEAGEGSLGNLVSTAAGEPPDATGSPARSPRTSSEVPSREDGRENVQTILVDGKQLPPATTNQPAEHGNY